MPLAEQAQSMDKCFSWQTEGRKQSDRPGPGAPQVFSTGANSIYKLCIWRLVCVQPAGSLQAVWWNSIQTLADVKIMRIIIRWTLHHAAAKAQC